MSKIYINHFTYEIMYKVKQVPVITYHNTKIKSKGVSNDYISLRRT